MSGSTTGYTEINLNSYVNMNVASGASTFPTGTTDGNQGLAIPFTISTLNGEAASWNPDYIPGESVGANVAGQSLTVNLLTYNLSDESSFYALLNNYWGTNGANEYNITVKATNGDSVTFSSIGGADTRDYNRNAVNTISNTTSDWFINSSGAQRLDAREFTLPASFATETLASFTITQVNAKDAALFSGLTFSTSVAENFKVVLQPAALAVTENQAATAIGIAAPYDSGFTNSQLSIAVTALPTDGTVTLANGTTAVTVGESLTAAQLTGLEFKPTAGAFSQSSTFSYSVTDPDTNTAIGTATLSIGAPITPVVTLAVTPKADNATTATLGTAVAGAGGDALSVTLNSDHDFASGSSVSLVNGNLVYTPGTVTAADVGTDAISYTVTDTVTNAATVETQNVTLANTPNPVVTLATTVSASNAAVGALGTAVAGAHGDALAVTLTSDADFATGSSISLVNGTLDYTPGAIVPADAGNDTIKYNVTDTVTGAVTSETQSVGLSYAPAPVVTQTVAPAISGNGTVLLGTAQSAYSGTATISGYLTADNACYMYISTNNSTLGTYIGNTTN